MAAIIVPGQKEVRTFETMTADLLALSDWALSLEITDVAMESTGEYWKPVYNILEENFRLAARRGKKRAIVAVAHSILVISYFFILRKEPYRELGGNYFDQRRPEVTAKRLLLRLQQLGYDTSHIAQPVVIPMAA